MQRLYIERPLLCCLHVENCAVIEQPVKLQATVVTQYFIFSLPFTGLMASTDVIILSSPVASDGFKSKVFKLSNFTTRSETFSSLHPDLKSKQLSVILSFDCSSWRALH